jgi:hypothetical protein
MFLIARQREKILPSQIFQTHGIKLKDCELSLFTHETVVNLIPLNDVCTENKVALQAFLK